MKRSILCALVIVIAAFTLAAQTTGTPLWDMLAWGWQQYAPDPQAALYGLGEFDLLPDHDPALHLLGWWWGTALGLWLLGQWWRRVKIQFTGEPTPLRQPVPVKTESAALADLIRRMNENHW